MSTLTRAGTPSRLRTGGVALLGLAAIAALIGVVLAVNRAVQTTAPGPAAEAPVHASAPARPSVIPFPPPIAPGPDEAPVVSATAVPATAVPGGEAPPASEKTASRGEVRVYNNSTIRGLAARAARDLSAAGWTVAEVGNFARGTVPTTTVYYQEGTDQRAEAEEIATRFTMRVEPRFPGISQLPAGIIVIVTNEYAH